VSCDFGGSPNTTALRSLCLLHSYMCFSILKSHFVCLYVFYGFQDMSSNLVITVFFFGRGWPMAYLKALLIKIKI
jgi:hypothetical protein